METKELDPQEAERLLSAPKRREKYEDILNQVKVKGTFMKVSGLTRGQVAALYRKAKEEGLRVRANYKEGYVVLGP